MERKLYRREKYLRKIRPFMDSDLIKVITGIRRCGKSSLLRLIADELRDRGVDEKDIVFLPLDSRGYRSIKTPEALEKAIEERRPARGVGYLFIDEVQNVKGFESLVHAYQEEGWSIFLTGSNSYLLSDEISTKLTGRYLSFEVFPLDFREYVEMKAWDGHEVKDLDAEFMSYLKEGGFPKALEFKEENDRLFYNEEVLKEIFIKDVRSRNQIRNLAAYERVRDYLIANFSAPLSLTNVLEAFEKEKLPVKLSTLSNYVEDIKKAKIVYECLPYDLKSKASLKRISKRYLADLSLFHMVLKTQSIDYGNALENLVYLYLIGEGYEVSYGRIGKFEIDFVATDRQGERRYIQVAYSLNGVDPEKIREREYRPYRSLKDGYPRYLITLDKALERREGVRHLNAIDLFMGNATL